MPDSLRQDVAKREITQQCDYTTNTIHLKKNRHALAPIDLVGSHDPIRIESMPKLKQLAIENFREF
jgi:hypothetical protein